MSSWHRDAFGRVCSVKGYEASSEHYIDPSDGRLVRLLVQRMATAADREDVDDDDNDDDGIDNKDNSRWVRIGPPRKDVSPVLRLVYWAYSSVLVEGTERRRWDASATMELTLKWIPSCLLLVLMVG